jgi:hypothetical protein
VSFGAAIQRDEAGLRTNRHLFHLFAANWTRSGFFLESLGGLERLEQAAGPLGILKQLFEFAAIQPDASAGQAIICFDTVHLEGNHWILANGAIHLFRFLKFEDMVAAAGAAVKRKIQKPTKSRRFFLTDGLARR